MKWCTVAALAVAGGLVATAASAAAPPPDAVVAPGSPAAPVVTPVSARTHAWPRESAGTGPRLAVPPASPFTVIVPFDLPPTPWASGHRGVDIAAAPGRYVRAPGDGIVTFAGWVVDRGVVVVAHDGGLRSSFEPVDPVVAVGTRVRAGDRLGRVSASGWHCSDEPCVHWGVRTATSYVDPLDVLDGYGPIRLLPMTSRMLRS